MNTLVFQLFRDLEGREFQRSNNAVVSLNCLLERYFWPHRNDELWGMVLTEQLLSLQLTQNDVQKVFDRSFKLIASNDFSFVYRVALAQVIGLYAGAKHLFEMVSFFSTNISQMTEQQTFSLLASLSAMVERTRESGEVDLLKSAIEENDFRGLLQNCNGSLRLQESAERLSTFLKNVIIE
jgi:hypothetical protein